MAVGLLAAGCSGGGGGGRLKGAGNCSPTARAEAGIKNVDEVSDHLTHIVRKVVLARSAGIQGKAPPADLVACVADAYRRDEERLFAAYRGLLREWSIRVALYLGDPVVLGRGTILDGLKEFPAEARATGRDLGYTAGVLSEAGKVAGDDKDKTEELLQRLEKCPWAFLFVAFRNDLTVSQTLYKADPAHPQPKVLEGQGYEVIPKTNDECTKIAAKFYSAYDDDGAGLSLVDVVLSVHGDLVEDYEHLYRSELLDRLDLQK